MSDELTYRLQGLPQELQDHIYGYTVAMPTNTCVTITAGYRPPVALYLSRKTRASAVAGFYGTNTFQIPTLNHYPGSPPSATILAKWYASIPLEHWDLISEVMVFRLSREDTCGYYSKFDNALFDVAKTVAAGDGSRPEMREWTTWMKLKVRTIHQSGTSFGFTFDYSDREIW